MTPLTEQTISCPYCGESINVLIDSTDAGQEYIEDCQVCCRPIVFVISSTHSGEPTVAVHGEDESY